MPDIEPTFRWFFFNVILALMPVVVNFVLVRMVKIDTSWYRILKDGELFIFSSTISASSIGTAIIQRQSGSSVTTVTICALLIVLMLSAAMFAVSSYFKFKQEIPPDERLFGVSSVYCAALAVLLSYIVAASGGIK